MTWTDLSALAHPSLLEGYEGSEPLPVELNEDGKSVKNHQHGIKSKAYEEFPDPLAKDRRGGFDVHIYHFQNNPDQAAYARALYERIRREFPELRVYRFFDRPVGPHPIAMFEVNLFTPEQFGAFIPWLIIHRGPLSALLHPNTDEIEEELNHTQRATWLGEKVPLDLRVFKLLREAQKKRDEEVQKEASL
ncbi:DOPA-like domain-containing protein [Aspergillus avenaceus]|uniref:DOPA-like domain-containing protein n=1 Tax=Aspergillus avenaceus TaxID=36643 RepID=A0A5N6TW19_ASPAV|nr:DOPA-like domain-containing protein [Aspergillus avenaceus]